jgi:putative tricarboxylic transport membrane protein
MRRLDFPIAPVILGVILGPMMEQQFRRSLVIANGDLSVFLRRPLTLAMLILAVAAIPRLIARIRGRQTTQKIAFGEEA